MTIKKVFYVSSFIKSIYLNKWQKMHPMFCKIDSFLLLCGRFKSKCFCFSILGPNYSHISALKTLEKAVRLSLLQCEQSSIPQVCHSHYPKRPSISHGWPISYLFHTFPDNCIEISLIYSVRLRRRKVIALCYHALELGFAMSILKEILVGSCTMK